ncbi:tripartite tricarboxylate transporter TctB family protein [Thalassobacillus sp. CUG 92003]|uniref:tripartite tricarboxylate transporter TctB family protein n=1 Tax=Thalassobacillus sp. CUG 92003 TaxID=2736641 RepID=UPI0015E77D44|nr:tripartite tricarboxylate transporter TctB family protein [Thalassobacillus sp. CUG 92003]
MKNQDVIVGALSLVLAVLGMVASSSLPTQGTSNVSAGFYPLLLFILLGLCSLGILWRGFKKVERNVFPSFKWTRIIPFILLIIFYAFSLNWAGFLISTLIFMVTAMRILGEHKLWKLAGIPLLSTFAIYITFVHLFQITLPS